MTERIRLGADWKPRGRNRRWLGFVVLLFVLFVGSYQEAEAARIGELIDLEWKQQAMRFLRFEDASVRNAVIGACLMGISCGLLGGFLVVRRLSLVGDTLSHAVLPGVALGFLWNMSKDPTALVIGAALAGALGIWLSTTIRRTTLLKEDACLGMVLSGFFALGVCFLTMIQNLPYSEKSGLQTVLFGQAAALSSGDIWWMAGVTLAVLVLVPLLYHAWLLLSFQEDFAKALGWPTAGLHHCQMILLAFVVVISIQATGVVLVTAMLILPAAAARLLTDRMPVLLLLSGVIGVAGGVSGVFLSFLGRDFPTGPFMVLATFSFFATAVVFAPGRGLMVTVYSRGRQKRRIHRENVLKAVFRVLESDPRDEWKVTLGELAQERNSQLRKAEREARGLEKAGLGALKDGRGGLQEREFILNEAGQRRACEIVRNHRLWELYLTEAAGFPSDHVHDSAEQIEHLIGDETVRALEKRLNHPVTDPHGRIIPSRRPEGESGEKDER